MESTTGFVSSLGVEIFASGHRRWPDAVKAQAVAESLAPGATVKGVAACYGVKPNQLSAWRCLAKQGKLVLRAAEITDEPTAFAPLVVHEPEIQRVRQGSSHPAGILRIAFGEATLELAGDTPAQRIAEIVHALGASS